MVVLLLADADMTFDGTNLTLANNLYASKVGAQGDTNNLIDLSSADTQDFNIDSKSFMTFTEVGSSGDTIVFNEGSNNIDFRIESDDNANMFVMDAGQNRIGIGTASPNSKMTVQGDLDIPIGSRFRAGCGASGVHTGVDIYYNNTVVQLTRFSN